MIVTARARWILVAAVAAALLGTLYERLMLSRLGMAIGVWVGMEWIAFRLWIDWTLRRARVERVVSDHGGPVRTLWENRVFRAEVRITLPRSLGMAYAELSDRIPRGVEIVDGQWTARMVPRGRADMTLRYSMRPTSIGVLRMEGIRVVTTDLHGLFFANRFLPIRQQYRVLPPLFESGSITPAQKRHNQLPPPGLHAHLRPGMGSELMEIRAIHP